MFEAPVENKFTFNFLRKVQRKSIPENTDVHRLKEASYTVKLSKNQSERFFAESKTASVGSDSAQVSQLETFKGHNRNLNSERNSEEALRRLPVDSEKVGYEQNQKALKDKESVNSTQRSTPVKQKMTLELRSAEITSNIWTPVPRNQKPFDPSNNNETNLVLKQFS